MYVWTFGFPTKNTPRTHMNDEPRKNGTNSHPFFPGSADSPACPSEKEDLKAGLAPSIMLFFSGQLKGFVYDVELNLNDVEVLLLGVVHHVYLYSRHPGTKIDQSRPKQTKTSCQTPNESEPILAAMLNVGYSSINGCHNQGLAGLFGPFFSNLRQLWWADQTKQTSARAASCEICLYSCAFLCPPRCLRNVVAMSSYHVLLMKCGGDEINNYPTFCCTRMTFSPFSWPKSNFFPLPELEQLWRS